ncbi:MAG: Unknown protein [uncultured Aureispira sp.]|uniref:OmpA-like domain-containing protein n=1 Tax=uncultured Aureispira sp. TaxID=1331704 RepID=A0A6S6U507_9BACT|nr:MAG: Unknown protein [uncultured Aureispira sp.]
MKKGTSIEELEDALLQYKALFERDTKDNVKELKDIAKMLATVATIKKYKVSATDENRKDNLSDPKFSIRDEGSIIKEETKDFITWKVWRVIEYTNPAFTEARLRIGYTNITQAPEPMTTFDNGSYNDFPKRPSTAYNATWAIANQMENNYVPNSVSNTLKAFWVVWKKEKAKPINIRLGPDQKITTIAANGTKTVKCSLEFYGKSTKVKNYLVFYNSDLRDVAIAMLHNPKLKVVLTGHTLMKSGETWDSPVVGAKTPMTYKELAINRAEQVKKALVKYLHQLYKDDTYGNTKTNPAKRIRTELSKKKNQGQSVSYELKNN